MTEYEKLLLSVIPFREIPVTIDEFLDNDYYLQKAFPVQVYPYWREQLRKIYPNNIVTPYTTIVLSGGIGCGKSSVSEIITLYDIYKISCLKDPALFFGISSQNGYSFVLYNIYKHKMLPFSETVQTVLTDKIVGSPYFLRQLELGNRFLNDLRIIVAAKPRDMISLDVIGFHLSELNSFSHCEQAINTINSANSRLWGRFERGKRIFNHIILDSSTISDESPIEKWILQDPEPDHTLIIRPNIWEVKAHTKNYFQLNPPSFKMYIGDGQNPPHIMSDGEAVDDEEKVIECPTELRNEAEIDPVLFLQEKAGIAVHSSDLFFQNIDRVKSFCKFKYDLPNPVIILDFFEETDKLINYVEPLIKKYLPIDRQIFIAVDNAYSADLLGFSIGYVDNLVRSAHRDDSNVNRSHISIPITFGVFHKKGQLIPINKVVDFIVQLSSKYDLGHVWFDSFQSQTIQQPLLQNNIQADISSVDKTEEPYTIARSYIYQGLVDLNDNPILIQGFKSVRRLVLDSSGRGKIVHNKGTGCKWDGKDLLDPVVNLIFNISNLPPLESIEKSDSGKIKSYGKALQQYANNINGIQRAW